jgi:hypothetical protein
MRKEQLSEVEVNYYANGSREEEGLTGCIHSDHAFLADSSSRSRNPHRSQPLRTLSVPLSLASTSPLLGYAKRKSTDSLCPIEDEDFQRELL